jgi:glycosyltransferase involved in cell wall biosynthesis
MRIVVSTSGRFHHFDLAKQLCKRGYLERLFTAYPKHLVKGLPRNKVTSFPYMLYIEKLLIKIGNKEFANKISPQSHNIFDRFVSQKLEKAEIVVCNHGCGLFTYKRARELGAKVICDCGQPHIGYIYKMILEEYSKWGKKFWYDKQFFEKRLLEYEEADLITVPSKFAAQTFFQNGYDPLKIAVIPYGVDLSLFKPLPKEDNKFRVIYVGRVEILKGIPYLLDALGNICSTDFELMLVGPVTNYMKKTIAKYKGDIKIVGSVSKEKLSWYYSQASVMVLPSMLEGMALVMAEAMACGIPVIATSISGAEDLFTDGVEGFIIPPRNSEDILEKVTLLIENPSLRQEMALAAFSRACKLSGWDAYGMQIVRAYCSQLLSKKINDCN